MKNPTIKVTVNVIKSKSPISFINRNPPSSPFHQSHPLILSSSIKSPLPLSKSIPKDLPPTHIKSTFLKLQTDETPTFDVESNETSSLFSKPQPLPSQNTKPRILSVIWTTKSKDLCETKTNCPYESTSAPIDNNIINTKYNNIYNVNNDKTFSKEEEDVSNFLNYKLGDINNESESIILGALNNYDDINKEGKLFQYENKEQCKCNNNNITTSKTNKFHFISNYANVKNGKNQHVYKNSTLKEMEFDLSNLQLFSVDDFNTSYSRSIYNNDISEMKPNENINNVYMMNTCFTFSNQRLFMNRNNNININSVNNINKLKNDNMKGNADNKKKGIRCDNGNKNKRCQTNPTTRIVKDKSKTYVNKNNNGMNCKGVNLKKSCNNIYKKSVCGNNNNNMKNSYVSGGINCKDGKNNGCVNNVSVIKNKNSGNSVNIIKQNGSGLNGVVSKKSIKTVSINKKRNVGLFMKDYKQQPQTWEH